MSVYSDLCAYKKLITFSGIFTLAVALSGCGSLSEKLTSSNSGANSNAANTARTSDDNPKSTDTASVPAPVLPNSSNGICSNEYYPLLPNEKRNYKITGTGPAEYSLIQKDITDSGFKEQRDFASGTSVVVNWICTPDGLRMAEFKNDVLFKQGAAEMETLESSGISLPKVWEAGKEFESEYKVKVNLNIGSLKANADGTIKIKSKVEALNEPLTVNGNSYNTARVVSRISISITMKGKTMQGASVDQTNWFSSEEGIVKQETTGSFGKNTVELVRAE